MVRIYSREDRDGDTEWVKDHATDFVEVTLEEFAALRDFTFEQDRRESRSKGYRFLIVEDETHLLPKTISEALEYVKNKKEEWAKQMEKYEKEKKTKERAAKNKKVAKLQKQIADLEIYKAKLAKPKKGK